MLCPVCKDVVLTVKEIESGLSSHQCGKCSGRWVGSFHYWKWKDASGKCLTADAESADELIVEDNTSVKLCPECGHFLRRFPVGHGVEFGLDRCGNCGGMWFDNNEWEALRGQGICGDVHKIFSQIWQSQVASEDKQKAFTEFYKEKFGQDDYKKIVEIKDWITGHSLQSELRAFLAL